MKKIGFLFLLGLGSFVAYLLVWPAPIDPVSWDAPITKGYTKEYQTNTLLESIKRLEFANGEGPEGIAISEMGTLYAGLKNGHIIRLKQGENIWEKFADTAGRPLGLHFDKKGNLIVCDSYKGLLSVDTEGNISVLSTESEGRPFRITDELDIADDGKIYFSDASDKFSASDFKYDALEHRPHGRLVMYDPDTKKTHTLLSNLYFPSGVSISPDQNFVLVNETWNYRVLRYWIAGPKKGSMDVFIDELPGFPRGLSSNNKDTFWLALASPRNPILDYTANKPFLRKILANLPRALQPTPKSYLMVLGLNTTGQVTANLQDPKGLNFSPITSVEENQGWLYLGSLKGTAVGRYRL